LAALIVTGLDDEGRPKPAAVEAHGPYAAVDCTAGCLDVELRVVANGEWLTLPLPTGHALAVSTVRVNGAQVVVIAGADGRPLLQLPPNWSGRLRYRTAPSAAADRVLAEAWPDLPPRAAETAASITGMTAAAATASVTSWVAREVRYDASDRIVAAHAEAGRQGLSFFERALRVGAGDCDVQNALAAAILAKAGVPARLAVGWVGIDGRAASGLHAWVEYLGEDGSWRVADASARGPRAGASDPPPVAAPNGSEKGSDWLPLAALVGVLVAAATAAVHARYRWQRHHHSGSRDSAVGLLRGAAVRPEAFAGVDALFRRPVVPRVGGRPVSLERVRLAARKGKLAVGRPESRLAADASAAGRLVLDGSEDAGAAVGDVLGATDLDAWGVLLAGSRSDPVLDAVEHSARQAGESCTLRIGTIGPDTAVLDLARNGVGTRWVVLNEAGSTWLATCSLCPERAGLAALVVGETVVDVLGLSPCVRSRILSRLARRALAEARGGSR
jgi:transglutaminase-like putative cysteine protease